jgi:hypothetical protein
MLPRMTKIDEIREARKHKEDKQKLSLESAADHNWLQTIVIHRFGVDFVE